MRNIHESVFLAPGSYVLGDVTLGENCGVWYNAVIRGDSNAIVIGKNTNIQDNAVLHLDKEQPMHIGDNVTIGHGAIIHGCTIGNNVLIGMGAIILNGAVIGDNCIVGAGTLITQGKQIPEGSMLYGNPAKVARVLTEEEIESVTESAAHYVEAAMKEKVRLAGEKNI